MAGRGMNPRQMQQAMRKMGIKNESMKGVTQVIIRTADREYVFDSPDVNIMTVQGQKTYQLTGEPAERPLGETAAAPGMPEEDIELVMSQTGCGRDAAIKALEENNGQPAEAILQIMTG
ncbi:MAG: nascent polypeptide-associated complex protein [Candidatus Methanomethylophilaceae archaeon]|jgi:nascent polypeptide-associated complex subunit alpha|nr:nascent polypeptide-associated complex protein [Candidatus Methanomethylophilaceae archaeon]